jgi:hypothetical protein
MINTLIKTLEEINSKYEVRSINCDQEMMLFGLSKQLTQEEQNSLPEHTEYKCEVSMESKSGFPFIILFPYQFGYINL